MTKDPRRFYVYAYLRSKDSEHGKKYSPYYIGKGARDRATSKARTIPKPSDPAFIVYVQEGLAESEAFSLEKYCVAMYGRIDMGSGILRNLSDGGEGPSGTRPSEEIKRKIAEAGRGRKHTEESKQKIGEAQKGMKNHNWGQTASASTREKMSKAGLGKKRSLETRAKIAAGKTKYKCRLLDPQGTIYEVFNLYAFSQEKKLHYRMLCDLVNGQKSKYKKWTCLDRELLR